MNIFVIQLYSNMRVVVQKRGDQWEVWPQKHADGGWQDHSGGIVSARPERAQAMRDALIFSLKLLQNLEGPAAFGGEE